MVVDSPALGPMLVDPDVDDWLVSQSVAVPLFDGLPLPFFWEGDLDSEQFLEAAESASRSFLQLAPEDRAAYGPALSEFCQKYLQMLGRNASTDLEEPDDVWAQVTPYEVFVRENDEGATVTVRLSVRWDVEHSCELHFPEGQTLKVVRTNDGYITVLR